MSSSAARAAAVAIFVAAAPFWASSAHAGPPGSPGYCPGDGLLHDWDTGKAFGSCPVGGGFVSTPKGNVWVDRNGTVHQAPTPQSPGTNGSYPDQYSSDNGDEPNPRPMPIRPGSPPPSTGGNAGAIGGPP